MKLWALSLPLFLFTPIEKQDERIAKFERVLSQFVDAELFTGSVLIAEKGQILFSKSYGFANREHHVLPNKDTKFRIGSITKQFTASAIMLLQQRGLLSVKDPIRKYLPDYPPVGERISIEQLLLHTSGISNRNLKEDFDWSHQHNLTELVDSFKHKPLEFEPGKGWRYSNSGYLVLGLIIEKVSGQKYSDFLQENVFKPAHLNNTLLDRSELVIPNRAQGYERFTGVVLNSSYIEPTLVESAGAMLSTIDDLFAWDRALYENKILNEKTKEEMFQERTQTHFGYGWVIDQRFGHKRVHHDGAVSGFIADFARYIDVDATIITFNNTVSEKPNSKLLEALEAVLFSKEVPVAL